MVLELGNASFCGGTEIGEADDLTGDAGFSNLCNLRQ